MKKTMKRTKWWLPALILLTAGVVVGLPLLVAAYRRIYEKYKA